MVYDISHKNYLDLIYTLKTSDKMSDNEKEMHVDNNVVLRSNLYGASFYVNTSMTNFAYDIAFKNYRIIVYLNIDSVLDRKRYYTEKTSLSKRFTE